MTWCEQIYYNWFCQQLKSSVCLFCEGLSSVFVSHFYVNWLQWHIIKRKKDWQKCLFKVIEPNLRPSKSPNYGWMLDKSEHQSYKLHTHTHSHTCCVVWASLSRLKSRKIRNPAYNFATFQQVSVQNKPIWTCARCSAERWEPVRRVSHGWSCSQQGRWPRNCRKLQTHTMASRGISWLLHSPLQSSVLFPNCRKLKRIRRSNWNKMRFEGFCFICLTPCSLQAWRMLPSSWTWRLSFISHTSSWPSRWVSPSTAV